ncbi:unnamed protein product, partial [Thlaspi arvense]
HNNVYPSGEQLKPWSQLEGKVVLVTGASSGLGREFCWTWPRPAAKSSLRLAALLRLLFERWPSSLVSRPNGSAIEAAVQRAWDAFGCIHTLINNAGVRGSVSSPLELSEEEWNKTFRTNVTGAWLVAKFVCTRMMCERVREDLSSIFLLLMASIARTRLVALRIAVPRRPCTY